MTLEGSCFGSDSISIKFADGIALFSESNQHHANQFSDFRSRSRGSDCRKRRPTRRYYPCNRSGRICLWARTLPCDVPFRPSDAFYRCQFSVDCTITMFGSDFRRGHPSADDHPHEGEVFRSLHTEAPTRHTTHLRKGEIRMTSPPAPASSQRQP